jgi:threonine dehydrogenase-like Zn-dependent dehydrogenase
VRALVLTAGRVRLVDDWPEPVPGPGEARVAVRLAGLCATDLALARGYMGFEGVPGHEFVGTALDGPLAGSRVVGEINAGCGRCPRCLRGDPRHCSERSVLGILGRGGAFAERLVLPAANLLPVPDDVSDEAAVLVEPLAAAYGIAEVLGSPLPARALVVGDGRLGLLCALALADLGVSVDVLGRHPGRGQLLGPGARHLGRELVRGAPPSRRYPLVVEASGQSALLPAAAAWVEPRGTLVLKTTSEAPVAIDTAPWVIDELAVRGSRCGRFAPALEALGRGVVPVEAFTRERLPLREGEAAFARASTRGVLKVLLDIMAP